MCVYVLYLYIYIGMKKFLKKCNLKKQKVLNTDS